METNQDLFKWIFMEQLRNIHFSHIFVGKKILQAKHVNVFINFSGKFQEKWVKFEMKVLERK